MGSTTPYRLVFAAQGEMRSAARALEARGRHAADTFEEYEASSLFVVVADARDEVVGACRVILPGPAGFKTLDEVEALSWPAGRRLLTGLDAARTWDIASCSVRRGSGPLVPAALCHGLVRALRTNEIRYILATLAERQRRTLSSVGLLPIPVAHGRGRTHVWGQVGELLDVQRIVNREGYRLVSCGHGFDGVRFPAADELLVTPPLRAELAWAKVQGLPRSA
jgi:hypothetical protein